MRKQFVIALAALLCFVVLNLRVAGQSEQGGSVSADSEPSAAAMTTPTQLVGPLPPPATKIETFAARKGMVIIKNYTKVGDISGDDGSSIEISAVQMSDANGTEKARGLLLQVRQIRRGERSAISYIDEDEIDPLISGCETLAKIQPATSHLTGVDGSYRTRGDLEIVNSDYNGTRAAGVRSTQILYPSGQIVWSTSFLRLGRLDELQHHLAAGKKMLDELKAPPAAAEK